MKLYLDNALDNERPAVMDVSWDQKYIGTEIGADPDHLPDYCLSGTIDEHCFRTI